MKTLKLARSIPADAGPTRLRRRRVALVCLLAAWFAAVGAPAEAAFPQFYHAGIAGNNNGVHMPVVLANDSLPLWTGGRAQFAVLGWDQSGSNFIYTDGGLFFHVLPLVYSTQYPTAINKSSTFPVISINDTSIPRCGEVSLNGQNFSFIRTYNFFDPTDCSMKGAAMRTYSSGSQLSYTVGRLLDSGGNDRAVVSTCQPNLNPCTAVAYYLPTLGAPDSTATGVNSSGLIVGRGTNASGYTRAFIYNIDTNGITDLDFAHTAYNNRAKAINDNNLTVGEVVPGPCPPSPLLCRNGTAPSRLQNSHYIAVMFAQGGKPLAPNSLGSLGGLDSLVYGINNAGTAVGSATTSTGAWHAYMSNNGVMTDLNSIPANGAAGWTMYEAYNINDAGQIVGRATGPHGEDEIFVLVP